MDIEFVQAVAFEDHGPYSVQEVANFSGLSEDDLIELVGAGVLEPMDVAARQWTFSAASIGLARTGCRLRTDFDLDLDALALALRLIRQIRSLETELQKMKVRVPGTFF